MKIVMVIGARPQFIKAAPVIRALREAGHKEILVHTGQHYDYCMSQIFFDELGIPEPGINLEVGSGSHARQTGQMLIGIEDVIKTHRPDWVLVYGDTNSTLAGALAAAKVPVPVAHVESGLRSFNRKMPEEINRVLTDHLSSLLFCPTQNAVNNLAREGIVHVASGDDDLTPFPTVVQTGDVMYDAMLFYSRIAQNRSHVLQTFGLEPGHFYLATIHRAENADDPSRMGNIMAGFSRIATSDCPVIFSVHPRTKKSLEEKHWTGRPIAGTIGQNVRIIAPVSFLDMVMLERSARLILTDSGGVQKEAFYHRVPCVTLRDETEWIELIELGWNRLCPPVSGEALAETVQAAVRTVGREGQPYGSGHAATEIIKALSMAASH
jgi:UDP-GlcNAc3NAcA epimerase